MGGAGTVCWALATPAQRITSNKGIAECFMRGQRGCIAYFYHDGLSGKSLLNPLVRATVDDPEKKPVTPFP